ncbi:carboxypeptidase regulatory-like domain-containing protein [Actinoplanes sp. NPDC049596]|uniref:carboxypeptidase regulatory-like domain-containing protein n=1 Tax=unclassified Actinoplanes TaxID=2626549 RepID=UPI0034243A9C
MNAHAGAPQPTWGRVLSLLWFPFFFAAVMSVVYVVGISHPAPTAVHLGVLDAAPVHLPAGIDVEKVNTIDAVRTDELAGVFDSATSTLYVSSAGSGTRADYLTAVLQPAHTVDVVPTASGDVTGVGLFFYGLPLLLVGMITSFMMLQFGTWPMRRKVVTLAAAGAFASVFAYAVAVGRDVIPGDEWLLLYGFLLTQAIGWITTALPRFVKQFTMPVAMTFVLLLGLPTAGGTVNADMLPTVLRWLHNVLPFGQFIEVARSSAYFGGHGLGRPLAVLIAWVVAAAALLAWAARPPRPSAPPVAEETGHRLNGTVRTTAGRPVPGATVLTLDDNGRELVRTTTGADGGYEVGNVRPGLHHLVVTAAHHEPEIVTIGVHQRYNRARDITLIDWNDPAGPLTSQEIDERRSLVS